MVWDYQKRRRKNKQKSKKREYCDKCKKEKSFHEYFLKNLNTGSIYGPICYHCLLQFHNNEMNKQADLLKRLDRLYQIIQNNPKLSCTPQNGYTLKILDFLEQNGCFTFKKNDENRGHQDYLFLVQRFYKSENNKLSDIDLERTEQINRKQILPFLKYFFRIVRAR